MDQLLALKQLNRYLKPNGSAKLVERSAGQLGLKEYVLRFFTSGNIPFNWPVSGNVDLEFVYNEVTQAWTCSGSMFGITPAGNEPKAWLHTVAQGVKSREQILNGALQRAITLWERYRGDLEQFAYRYGIEMAATGTMTKVDDMHVWTHTSHPDVQLVFSLDPEKPTYGLLQQSRLGFYPVKKTHTWYLSVENLTQLRAGIEDYSASAQRFCHGASACFGVEE